MTILLNSSLSRLLICILFGGTISFACKSEGSLNVSDNERMIAQGFWEAGNEEVFVLQQDGISALGWLAVDALSFPDSVSVTWPDPLGCTSSRGVFEDERKLKFSTEAAEVSFSFLSENKAVASYSQDGQTATLIYEKKTTDASVICF